MAEDEIVIANVGDDVAHVLHLRVLLQVHAIWPNYQSEGQVDVGTEAVVRR